MTLALRITAVMPSTRACRAIGCSGFQDLKLKLAQSLAAGASFGQFELLAWRTLGEALLLIDMYEHQSDPAGDLADAAPPRSVSALQRVRAWWARLRR